MKRKHETDPPAREFFIVVGQGPHGRIRRVYPTMEAAEKDRGWVNRKKKGYKDVEIIKEGG